MEVNRHRHTPVVFLDVRTRRRYLTVLPTVMDSWILKVTNCGNDFVSVSGRRANPASLQTSSKELTGSFYVELSMYMQVSAQWQVRTRRVFFVTLSVATTEQVSEWARQKMSGHSRNDEDSFRGEGKTCPFTNFRLRLLLLTAVENSAQNILFNICNFFVITFPSFFFIFLKNPGGDTYLAPASAHAYEQQSILNSQF
jgi:hypothetical protein